MIVRTEGVARLVAELRRRGLTEAECKSARLTRMQCLERLREEVPA